MHHICFRRPWRSEVCSLSDSEQATLARSAARISSPHFVSPHTFVSSQISHMRPGQRLRDNLRISSSHTLYVSSVCFPSCGSRMSFIIPSLILRHKWPICNFDLFSAQNNRREDWWEACDIETQILRYLDDFVPGCFDTLTLWHIVSGFDKLWPRNVSRPDTGMWKINNTLSNNNSHLSFQIHTRSPGQRMQPDDNVPSSYLLIILTTPSHLCWFSPDCFVIVLAPHSSLVTRLNSRLV